MRSFKLGRLFDINIFLHPSWFIILLIFMMRDLVTGNILGALWSGLLCVGLFASVLGHEFAHILTARCYGIGTHKVVLHVFGGAAFIKKIPFGIPESVIGVAGPIFSFLLGATLYSINAVVGYEISSLEKIASTTLSPWFLIGILGHINIFLAGVNMLPIFPLDGGRIVRGIMVHFSKRIVLSTRIVTLGGLLVVMPLALVFILGINLWTIVICIFIGLLGIGELQQVETLYRDGRGKPTNLNEDHVREYMLAMELLGPDNPITQSVRRRFSSLEFDAAASNIDLKWHESGRMCEFRLLATKLAALGITIDIAPLDGGSSSPGQEVNNG